MYKDINEKEIIEMMKETSKLAATFNANILSSAVVAAKQSNILTNEVEFWKWMSRNYSKSGIFSSNESMKQYITQGAGKEAWMNLQLQGKGYEWDWMTQQRSSIENIFKKFDAGDVANRFGSDVTEINLINKKSREYQMKAYTGKNNPILQNTTKDITVVTNSEKASIVKQKGYDVVEYQNNSQIERATTDRMQKIKDGTVNTSYNFRNVANTMAKAGFVGCAIGIGTEAIISYRSWKKGNIGDEEYLKEVFKAGGDSGLTAAATSGVMIPVSAKITALGASSLITIPVAFIVSSAINKIVAPCFGRGEYKQILSKVKYYQNVEQVYQGLMSSMENASQEYYHFVYNINNQNNIHQNFKKYSIQMNKNLKNLYDSI